MPSTFSSTCAIMRRLSACGHRTISNTAHTSRPGRNGLFELTKALPSTLRYENGHAVAEGDLVILHGRFSGHGLKRNWIVADIVRLQDGVLVEHWDVIQDEATESESKSGRPMFGSSFAPVEAGLEHPTTKVS